MESVGIVLTHTNNEMQALKGRGHNREVLTKVVHRRRVLFLRLVQTCVHCGRPMFLPHLKKSRVGLAQFWQAPASPRSSDSLPEAPPEAGKPVVGADVQAHGMHFILYIYTYIYAVSCAPFWPGD